MKPYRLRTAFTLLLAIISITLCAQQPKNVYITLDVSGSMSGDKYALANYTTQMIVTLCDEQDDVSMIVYGVDKNLSRKGSSLETIQKPMNYLSFGNKRSGSSQFDDISAFNKLYKPSPGKQDWLFVIGDGIWSTQSSDYDDERDEFRKIVEGGTLNVCYLQTGENLKEQNDFTLFAESLGVIDIGKSSTNPKTIRQECDHFARKILGFSNTPLEIDDDGSKAIKIVAELPVKEILLVYQDDVTPQQLPDIAEATFAGNKLEVVHRGTPTTHKIKDKNTKRELSGHVWRLKAGKKIPANTEIVIEFDKSVDTNNVSVYPLVEEVRFGSTGFTPVGDHLTQIDDKTYGVCLDDKTARVRIDLSEKSKNSIPEQLLRKTRVVVKANNKEYTAKYQNGGFECTIDLNGEKTQYYAECDCPGYFNRVTPIKTIVKDKKYCDSKPPAPVVNRLQELDLGTMTFEQLKNEPIKGYMQDSESLETLDPTKFDITVEVENDYLYEEPKLSISGDMVVIDVHPKGDWCECLFPTDLNMTVVSTPKEGAFEITDKKYVQTVHPMHMKIEKERPWMTRCFWVIMTLIGLLILFLYLRALQRKRRFKKNAAVTPFYYDYYGNRQDAGSQYLRREGFGACFARWLLPFDERNTLSFDSPNTSLLFYAANSEDVVNIPKDGNIDPETMHISGYNPNRDNQPQEPVKLGSNGKINITNSNGNDEGYLVFTSGEQTDGALFRLVLSMLIVIDVIAFFVLLGMLVRSFFM